MAIPGDILEKILRATVLKNIHMEISKFFFMPNKLNFSHVLRPRFFDCVALFLRLCWETFLVISRSLTFQRLCSIIYLLIRIMNPTFSSLGWVT